MRKRYQAALALLPTIKLTPALALRQTFAAGYTRKDFAADALAGVVVGVVALPLAMALGINSGVAPQNGIYTAIIAGLVIAALGGSRVQVSGPTAAFGVILAPIAAKYGLGGLALATLMAGMILVVMGAVRLGRFVQFIPHPVTTGFSAGLGVVIATLQVKDFFGLSNVADAAHFPERVRALGHAFPSIRWEDTGIGLFTLAVLIGFPQYSKRIPAPLVGLAAGAVVAALLGLLIDDFQVATIRSTFSYLDGGVARPGIPQMPPMPVLPWDQPGAGGLSFAPTLGMMRELMGPAFAIAMLGAIESLVCAVVADGMVGGQRHDPDTELVAQGIGNMVAPFFGGIAATGALARTAANVRAGARSPVAAMSHAVFVLIAVVALAPLLGHLPMASLSALMLIVAWNMSEVRHFGHIVRVAPGSDMMVLLTCFTLTVVFDMVVAVSVGVMLAALLFMRRMAEIFESKLVDQTDLHTREPLPKGVLLYEIAGPLFFGATQKAISTLEGISRGNKVVILDMTAVPAMDSTGLVALESVIARLHHDHVAVVFAGVQPQPRSVFDRAEIKPIDGKLALCSTRAEAIELSRTMGRKSTEMAIPPVEAGT